MGRLCLWAVFAPGPFSYALFLHMGHFGMGRFRLGCLGIWSDLPESNLIGLGQTKRPCRPNNNITRSLVKPYYFAGWA